MTSIVAWLLLAGYVEKGDAVAVLNDKQDEVLFIPAQTYHGQYGDPLTLDAVAEKLGWEENWHEQLEALPKREEA